jgi:cbb3-type cytochrome oxidase maturation protein
MSYLVWLVPIALGMGVIGLAAFLWSMRAGQYDDLDGSAERVLLADASAAPLPPESETRNARGRSDEGTDKGGSVR